MHPTDNEEVFVDFDFDSLIIMPGLVDSAVHTNDPGRAGWEGVSVVSAAAAQGGFTSIVDLPVKIIPKYGSYHRYGHFQVLKRAV